MAVATTMRHPFDPLSEEEISQVCTLTTVPVLATWAGAAKYSELPADHAM